MYYITEAQLASVLLLGMSSKYFLALKCYFLLNTGYQRRSSRCLTPQRLCVHGATSLLPGPV